MSAEEGGLSDYVNSRREQDRARREEEIARQTNELVRLADEMRPKIQGIIKPVDRVLDHLHVEEFLHEAKEKFWPDSTFKRIRNVMVELVVYRRDILQEIKPDAIHDVKDYLEFVKGSTDPSIYQTNSGKYGLSLERNIRTHARKLRRMHHTGYSSGYPFRYEPPSESFDYWEESDEWIDDAQMTCIMEFFVKKSRTGEHGPYDLEYAYKKIRTGVNPPHEYYSKHPEIISADGNPNVIKEFIGKIILDNS